MSNTNRNRRSSMSLGMSLKANSLIMIIGLVNIVVAILTIENMTIKLLAIMAILLSNFMTPFLLISTFCAAYLTCKKEGSLIKKFMRTKVDGFFENVNIFSIVLGIAATAMFYFSLLYYYF